MKTAQRPYLLTIALLCMAILSCRTVRAAVSMEAFHPLTQSCRTKAAAEEPSSEKKVAVAVAKAVRPSRDDAHSRWGAGDQIAAWPQTTLLFAAIRRQQFLHADDALTLGATSRIFVLRI